MTDHAPMPVQGYTSQSDARLTLVNVNKEIEERLLRICDALRKNGDLDQRWVSIAATHFQEGFMALNRAVFQPQRIKLPEDQP